MDVGSQVAARGTGGTAADSREMHCSFPQRSASLQQPEAFLGIKYVQSTHSGVHTLVSTAHAGVQFGSVVAMFLLWMANLTSLQALLNQAGTMEAKNCCGNRPGAETP